MNIQNDKQRERPSFLVDGMLGSLARKLRILGFDTLYSADDDSRLMAIARETKRYLVTSDTELFFLSRRRKLKSILIVSRTDRDRLYEVLSSLGESEINLERSARCSVCNGELIVSGRREKERSILTCVSCWKSFWKGGHWKKLFVLFEEVDAMLRERRC